MKAARVRKERGFEQGDKCTCQFSLGVLEEALARRDARQFISQVDLLSHSSMEVAHTRQQWWPLLLEALQWLNDLADHRADARKCLDALLAEHGWLAALVGPSRGLMH